MLVKNDIQYFMSQVDFIYLDYQGLNIILLTKRKL